MTTLPTEPAPDRPPHDRREAVKYHNRRAIIDAAAALAEERGLGGFTVTDLADRAGVSRRTIFNHFAAADDAVHARFSELLGVFVDNFARVVEATPPPAEPSIGAVLEQLADVIERTELVPAMCHIARLMGASENSPTTAVWSHEVIETLTARLAAEITDRVPEAPTFTVDLLATLLLHALAVAFQRWAEETGAVDTPASRSTWLRVLREAVERLRHGFADPAPGGGAPGAGTPSPEAPGAGTPGPEAPGAGTPGPETPRP